MRFGVLAPSGWRGELDRREPGEHWPALRDFARRAEAAGYDSIWVYDHLLHEPGRQPPDPRRRSWPLFEAWTLLAALAVATDRLRLGQLVTNTGLRPSAYLAQLAGDVDRISGGRLMVGLGAGWNEDEHRHLGGKLAPVGERLDRLEATARSLRDAWVGVQRPHPPILIGGGGERRTLRITAELADLADFGGTPSLDAFRRKSAVLRGHCESLGRSFEELTLTAHLDCVVAPTRQELDRLRGRLEEAGYRPDDASALLAGTPDQLVEELVAWRDAGCRYLILYLADSLDGAGLELFGEEVLPHLA